MGTEANHFKMPLMTVMHIRPKICLMVKDIKVKAKRVLPHMDVCIKSLRKMNILICQIQNYISLKVKQDQDFIQQM